MKRTLACSLLMLLALSAVPLTAEETAHPVASPQKVTLIKRAFPGLYLTGPVETAPADADELTALPYSVPTRDRAAKASREVDLQNLVLNNQILAFYGSPTSIKMGILGRYGIADLTRIMDEYKKAYDQVNGEKGIVEAFYIIYGTAWPEGEIGYLRDARLMPYIEYAQANNMLVFVDHQIGKYTVKEAMNRILPYLKYDCVQLAIDPEWHTDKPMQEIGSINADDLNEAQSMMQDYMVRNDIPGRRMLVVHQFNCKMITNREKVRSDYDKVLLIHNADGFGAPSVKLASYADNQRAENMPLKGFKLFLKCDVVGAGFDSPLMPPADVVKLNPEPLIIMYQ